MAARLTNTYRQSAGPLAHAYGTTQGGASYLTDTWVTDRWTSITGQTAAGAADWLNLNHQILQFERFHCFPPLGEGPRSLRHTRLRAGKGR
jgi:hypothetical protein